MHPRVPERRPASARRLREEAARRLRASASTPDARLADRLAREALALLDQARAAGRGTEGGRRHQPSSGEETPMSRKLAAELIGTFWLTFAGCGSAVLAAAFPEVGIGLLGVSLAFGLTVVTMAYSVGHISGCHLNPAVTIGLAAGGRFPASQIGPYVVAQVAGGILAASVLYLIASGAPGFDLAKGFAANGYGEHSPGKYSMFAGLLTEVVMTMFFLFIIMGATHGKAPAGFAPLAIGLGLTLIHLVSIPVTNTSVNPARSTGPALFAGGWALGQLWLFWVAPLVGGAIGGALYRWLSEEEKPAVTGTPTTAKAG
jgi:aquaporin Z